MAHGAEAEPHADTAAITGTGRYYVDDKGEASVVSQPRWWRLGHCLAKSEVVTWSGSFLAADSEADHRFDAIQHGRRSVVLFREIRRSHGSDLLGLSVMRVSGRDSIDVAVILEASRHCHPSEAEEEEKDDISASGNESTFTTVVSRRKAEEQVRNGDAPMIPPSRSKVHQWALKRAMDLIFCRITVEFFAAAPHRMASLCYFNANHHPGVRGHIALSLDDAPGRLGPENSRLDEIRQLLGEYEAKATFMLVGKFIQGHEDPLVRLLREGHELGNHGQVDGAMHRQSDERIGQSIDTCSHQIEALQRKAGFEDDAVGVRYFRAPHGRYTKRMEQIVHTRHMVNVMCDAYASDPIIEDGDYIAGSLLRQARDGGIILLHMPERGFRDYCMVALRGLLKGLQGRGLQVVSVGMLEQLAAGCCVPNKQRKLEYHVDNFQD